MIANPNKRFSVFAANRLTKIEEHTAADQWRYVPSKENPADLATRRIDTESFVSNPYWLKWPEFLLDVTDLWPQPPCPLSQLPGKFSALKKFCSAVSKDQAGLWKLNFSVFQPGRNLKGVSPESCGLGINCYVWK